MHRIPLSNTVFEGANNVYLFDGEQTVLLDTGVAVEETRRELEAGLDAHDVAPTDLDAIVLTHYHADHSGLAGELQTVSDAPVYAHTADAPLIAGDEDAWDEVETLHEKRFAEWGMPADSRAELLAFLTDATDAGIYGESVDVTAFEDGETLTFGDLELEVIHAPGHTAGLCCFVPRADDSRNESHTVFTGDALLPQYTPNVGGADVRLTRPLAAYVRTLETLIERDFERAWPGHRDPIDEPRERATVILEHHEQRAFRVAETLESMGPSTAWEVSDALFGDLEAIHILHGPGEAFAHLEHLSDSGALEADEQTAETEALKYRLTEEGRERLTACDGERWPLRSRN